jgi:hypothetical protein
MVSDFASSLIFILIPLIATSIIGWKTIEYTKKQNERSAMKDIFGILGEPPHRSAEGNLYDAYKKDGTLMKDGKLDSNRIESAEVVKRNYEQVGMMLSSKLIPAEQYYQTFGILTVVSYFILIENLKQERKEHKLHMIHFANLSIDCFDFFSKQKEGVKPTITDPKGTPITREMLGDKLQLPK